MNLLIKAKDIRVEYVGRDVLDIDDLELYDYDRIGLVGGNGAGKSTLLKMLLGEISLPDCKISRYGTFSYIPQLDETVVEKDINHVLTGKLGVNQLSAQTMSGGEETRLKIAQALSGNVHGIFADEPTCHLDRLGIDFLISQLKYYSGALLLVSHDRYFLDEIVNKIWELKDGKIIEYWGGYSDYLQQKEEERQNQTAQYELYIAERNRLEQAAEEKRKQARKVTQKEKGAEKKNNSESAGRLGHQKTVGSKQKKLYNAAKNMEHRLQAMGDIQAPENIRTIRFRQSKSLELHNPYPITATDISKCFDDKVLFDKVSFQIPLGKKVVFTGNNGTGKTTLFQMILDREPGIYISPKAVIGYFAQTGYKYNHNQKVMEYMQNDCDYQVSEIRSVLASMGFSQNDINKELAVLSGGEIIKLQMAKMLLGRYNILLMDEPSNFLDIPSVEALQALIKNYTGTILFISHDKYLIENTADIVYEIADGTLKLAPDISSHNAGPMPRM
ncbi:macrolide transport system ATP-binding/permease protein [Anaerobacterium chartisolvens]|uniref:Macrolide transport system ATP-binding/permease protein n=1 Tax=Anaerobacterium chartisolvens TaxID=1297424 RepID=A0A369BBJ9_9FIRM|nr:Msr family ABC-F type ribosomal protection protein [Anaerobacterium chartisolvens]RCX18903.1 macrolide transport system ATP-binding/permease protein [Anaerobacterium chartisolvens]